MTRPPKNRKIPELSRVTAHRYVFPHPEVAAALIIAAQEIRGGSVIAYQNLSTGGVMLGHICEGCENHHGLIEVHAALEGEDEEATRERFLPLQPGNPDYGILHGMAGGELHVVNEPYAPARNLIRSLRKPFSRRDQVLDLGPIFEAVPALACAAEEGNISYALDVETGMTLACVISETEDAIRIRALLLIDMPKFEDMRQAKGYEFIGAPLSMGLKGKLQ